MFLCHALGGPLTVRQVSSVPNWRPNGRSQSTTSTELSSKGLGCDSTIWLVDSPTGHQVGIHHVSFIVLCQTSMWPPLLRSKKTSLQVISETFCATLCNLDTNASHLLVARTSVDTSKIENELMLLKSSVLHKSWENLTERNLTHTYKSQNSSYDSSGTTLQVFDEFSNPGRTSLQTGMSYSQTLAVNELIVDC